MRNQSRFSLFSMALLAGVTALTSCNSDEAFVDDNATPAAGSLMSGETVKTQFSINIPATGVNKRLTAQTTQADGTAAAFRGMKNIFMVPFALEEGASIDASSTLSPVGVIPLDEFSTFNNTPSNSYYSDVNIPVNTNNMLFYAEGGSSQQTEAKTYGKLTPVYDASAWSLTTSVDGAIRFELGQIAKNYTESTETLLSGALTDIAKAEGWSGLEGEDNAELISLYNNFTSLKSGSAENILYTVNNLYQITTEKAADGNIYETIQKAILKDNGIFTVNEGKLAYNEKLTDTTYPVNLNVPAGVAQLEFKDGAFKYKHAASATVIGSLAAADFTDYVYPTSLYYTVNSKISASSTSTQKVTSDDWNAYVTNTAQFNQNKVESNSQLVVLTSPVQYAVARFVVNAKFKESTLFDKDNHTQINLKDNFFKMKGLLVGGQHDVDWKFAPATGGTEYTVYDTTLDESATGVTTVSSTYQTLVLESQESAVNFAIEMENHTGTPFWGADGIVPEGGTFYMVGKLSPTDEHKTVFAQDFVTTANVTINSLANAYNVVPDLRATKLQFGLSVNLEWQSGLTQDITIE